MITSDKLSSGKQGRKYFMGYKNNESNKNNFFCVSKF